MTNPKNQVDLSKNRTRELLDLNNSARSSTSDSLLSILEAGEGSLYTRDILDQFLHNYLENALGVGVAATTLGYSRARLRQHLSVKDKVAYITAHMYTHHVGTLIPPTAPADIDNIQDNVLREQLEELIRNIEERLLNDRDFTESRILRNAAINRFECKLNTAERNELNSLANNIKQVCTDNNISVLANATDFTNESDAQKIMKIYEVLTQLSAIGIRIEENLVKGFEKFDEKIKPLKDLDQHYKHMTKTLNMIHRVAQKGYHSMVTPNQKGKVEKILDTLGEKEGVNKALLEYNKIDNFKTNNEHTFIEDLLSNIERNPKYEETLLANGISKAQFNEWFISLSAFLVTEQCKQGFESHKSKTFGARTKDFEKDTQSRRGMVKRRLFDIADRMVGNDFGSEVDFDTANSYFNKFKDLFFAKEEDNYNNSPVGHEEKYNRMERVTSALIRRRVPALVSSHRIRRGSTGRIIYKFLEHAIKGKDRGMFERIRRVRHNADDATVVAITIMMQNEATNQMFYQDRNKVKEPERRYGKLFRKIRFTEHTREGIRDAIAPTANKALQLTEIATKKGLQFASGTVKVANTVASKSVRGVTRATGGISGKFNGMIEKNGYKRRKTPLYLPYLITKPIQQGSDLLNKGATWTDKNLNGEIKKIDEKVGQGYEEAKKVVGEATGEETKYLFQGLTYATDQVTSLVGKTISAGGKAMHDAYTTSQQRGILGAFYAAASEQKGLEDLMQSSDLADILNLKERGPYLFDEDGRVLMVDKPKEKVQDTPEGSAEELSKQLQKQLDKLVEQAKEDVNKERENQEKANNSNDDKKKSEADINLAHANEVKSNISSLTGETSKLIPILKKVMTTAIPPVRRHTEINTITVNIDNTLNSAPNGLITKINSKIGDVGIIGSLKDNVATSRTNLATHSATVSMKENTLAGLNKALGIKDADTTAIMGQISVINGELLTAQTEKNKAENLYFETSRQLRNAENLLLRLGNFNETIKKIADINNKMHTALTAIPIADTKPIVEEILQLSRQLDILLHPETKTDGKSTDKTNKIKGILGRTDIDEKAKLDLLDTLLAA